MTLMQSSVVMLLATFSIPSAASRTITINVETAKRDCADAKNPGDDASGCIVAGTAYLTGNFTDQNGITITINRGLARKFFEAACDVEYPIGCASVGEMYQKRQVEPLPVNFKSIAYEYYKRGCSVRIPGYASNAATSCMAGAGLALGQRGTAETRREAIRMTAEAIALLERGCELGDNSQCASVAMLVR